MRLVQGGLGAAAAPAAATDPYAGLPEWARPFAAIARTTYATVNDSKLRAEIALADQRQAQSQALLAQRLQGKVEQEKAQTTKWLLIGGGLLVAGAVAVSILRRRKGRAT